MGPLSSPAMQALRTFSQWFHQVYSLQLVFLLALVAAGVRHLVKNAKTLPERRFIALSVAVALLGVLAIGAGFRTPLVARLISLPLGNMPERSLNWLKAMIAFSGVSLSIY